MVTRGNTGRGYHGSCGIILMVVFVGVKIIQRKESWGWEKLTKKRE